jgi:uncharacterized membrane protein
VDSESKAAAPPAAPEAHHGPDATARALGAILRVGVLISAAIIVAGVALFVHRRGAAAVLFGPRSLPAGSGEDPSTIVELLGALRNDVHVPAAVTDIGLLTLMVTPVLSVVVSLIAFARERDWTYVVLAAIVLGMLALGSTLGHV